MTSFVLTPADELLALLTLRFTPQLGPRRIEGLRQYFGSAGAALSASLGELREVPGLDLKSVAAIGLPKAAEQARAEVLKAQDLGVTLIGRGLDGYPPALEALGDPPAILWVLGDLPQLPVVPRAVGIVGTRAASPYAHSLTRQVAADLKEFFTTDVFTTVIPRSVRLAEAPSFGKPVLVTRETTERPEGVDAGTCTLVGTDIDRILSEVHQLCSDSTVYLNRSQLKNPYGDGKSSHRICEILAGALCN